MVPNSFEGHPQDIDQNQSIQPSSVVGPFEIGLFACMGSAPHRPCSLVVVQAPDGWRVGVLLVSLSINQIQPVYL